MTPHRADDLNGRIKEADGTPDDNDDLNPDGQSDQATSVVQPFVDANRWHYHHLSTP